MHTRRDGTQVTRGEPMVSAAGREDQPLGMLETNRDITERKQAEEAVRKAQAELAHVAASRPWERWRPRSRTRSTSRSRASSSTRTPACGS